jgi:uncharacterized protein
MNARTLWNRARNAWDMSLGRGLGQILIWLIRGYQLTISPMTGPTCRYHPTCSAYALAAVRVHGPLKGSVLASWRLLRCNPWSGGGIDFVPEKGFWRGSSDVRPTQPEVPASPLGVPAPADPPGGLRPDRS